MFISTIYFFLVLSCVNWVSTTVPPPDVSTHLKFVLSQVPANLFKCLIYVTFIVFADSDEVQMSICSFMAIVRNSL